MNVRTEAEHTSRTLEVLLREIAELAQKYLGEHQRLQSAAPGSEEFETSWAEVATLLSWLQEKIPDILEEMERLEDTWPEESP